MTRPLLPGAVNLGRRVARNLRRLRLDRGLTLEGVARACELNWRHIQKIEAGETNATIVSIARVAHGLGVDPLELMKPLACEGGLDARLA